MNIKFTKNAYNDYLNLPLNYKEMVDRTLDRLIKNIPVDIKPIQGEKDTFRIRVGKFKILFIKINSDIVIVKIKKREDIYK